jgi:hypothetical protein
MCVVLPQGRDQRAEARQTAQVKAFNHFLHRAQAHKGNRRPSRVIATKPLVAALKPWMDERFAKVPKGSKLGEALGYGQWDGLCRFLDDGRIEIDSNTFERSIRSLALTRKNALLAGHDLGAEVWAMTASLIETCKLNRVDPLGG